ncbi:unnamed protein product [Blepharisma stoltei]|uniref:FRIGIDA-like protein n=1 Tax=Blepharisma stoltei TaxID=1481888 RepID=A0AAU9IK61_9CILI|nr:unnamed protein product [Blepharisma stoltei]
MDLGMTDSLNCIGDMTEMHKTGSNFNSTAKISEFQRTSDQWDLNLLLEAEREKVSILEQKLANKEKLLEGLESLHSDLYLTIEELQEKEVKHLKEAKQFKLKYEAAEFELIKSKETIKIRNSQISKLKEIIDQKIWEFKEKKCEKCLGGDKKQKMLLKIQEKEEIIQAFDIQNLEMKQENIELKNDLKIYQEKCNKLQEELDKANAKIIEISDQIGSQFHSKKNSLKTDYELESSPEIKELRDHVKSLEEKINFSETQKIDIYENQELYAILGVCNEKAAIKRVLYLKHHYEKSKKYCKFYKKIVDILRKYPEIKTHKEISCKSAWTLLERIIEEFVILKASRDSDIMSKLCEIFNLKSAAFLIDYAEKIKFQLERQNKQF